MNNTEISDKLNEIADLLQEQNANPFRVNAYRRAAATISSMPQPVTELMEEKGFSGLTELPGIGEGIARSIYEYVAMGRMSRLESLRAGHDPVQLFEQVPGVGPKLAHQIIESLHIDTLEALELAAHNGRLETVPGFSSKKISMVQAWLAQILGRRRPVAKESVGATEPPVALLLQVDRQYRDKAAADELPKIAPKRFNPKGEAWLPVMHSTKGEWHFTALYSNTARAHQLGQTHDWVVIYFYDKEHREGQHTVVTETRGSLVGKRVVRGRERECQDHYFHKVG
ncbi:helix-hairpin-helix domain-containing protein [Kaarinaea lacus]